MSSNYSANQFDNAFRSNKLQNWEIQKEKTFIKKTQTCKPGVLVDNKNHLLPEYKKSHQERKLSNFLGTWEMPNKLPSYKIDIKTGRNPQAYSKLQEEFKIPRDIMSGKLTIDQNKTNGEKEKMKQRYQTSQSKNRQLTSPDQFGFYSAPKKESDHNNVEDENLIEFNVQPEISYHEKEKIDDFGISYNGIYEADE